MKTSESKAVYLLFTYKPMGLYLGLVSSIWKKISHSSLMGSRIEKKFREICEFALKLKP